MASLLWETRIRKLHYMQLCNTFWFGLVLLCILKYKALFSIKCFHRNLAVWNVPVTVIFVSLNIVMAQSLYLFNCIPFHCLQGCLLFKGIKNLPWSPDKAQMDRPYSVGGHGSYIASNKHLRQMPDSPFYWMEI